MKKQATIKSILVKARALLVKFGWKKHNVGCKGRPMCAIGAINMASHGDPSYDETPLLYARTVETATILAKAARLPNPSLWAVADWNNREDRTKSQVLTAFSKAIKVCKS